MTNRYSRAPIDPWHTFEEAVPYKDRSTGAEGCRCDMGDGDTGRITCHARCCKVVDTAPRVSTEVVAPENTTCTSCPFGTYTMDYGSSQCKSCPVQKHLGDGFLQLVG